MKSKDLTSDAWTNQIIVEKKENEKSGSFFNCQVVFNCIAFIFICFLILIIMKERQEYERANELSEQEENMDDCERTVECNELDTANVCGSDGLHYDSECKLKVTACRFPEMKLKEAHQSLCNDFKTIALIGGRSPSEGNIYTRNEHTGEFGPVCDDGWDFYGANVVCNKLGYNGALKFTLESYFGQVTPSFSYNFIKCYGSENELDDCKHSDVSECFGEEAAGVVCSDGTNKNSNFQNNNPMFPQIKPDPPIGKLINNSIQWNGTTKMWYPPVNKFQQNKENGTDCFEMDTEYFPVDILKSCNVSDHFQCQHQCQNLKNCNYFTFKHSDTHGHSCCFLKDQLYGKSKTSGMISGPKICPNFG